MGELEEVGGVTCLMLEEEGVERGEGVKEVKGRS